MVERARAYRAVVEAIGLLGVIGSLTFVGLEVRGNSIATRAANDSAVADGFRDENLAIATSAALGNALVATQDDPQAASPQDQMLTLALWRAGFHNWSNAYRQHLNGTLDPELWASIVQEISAYSEKPSASAGGKPIPRGRVARWAWKSERFLYSPDFRRFVDKALGIKQ